MENPISIREMALKVGQPAIDEYLVESEGQDPDFIAIKKFLLVDGLSLYAAIRKQWESGESNRSEATIRYHALSILQEIYKVFGGGISSCLNDLMWSGEAFIEFDAATLLRSACRDMGVKWKEDIRFRLVDSNG